MTQSTDVTRPVNWFLSNIMINICAIIPCYNHDSVIADTVRSLSEYVNKIIIVDDGSNDATRDKLQRLSQQYGDLVHLFRLDINCGKGCAVKQGIRIAHKQGFTHAIQIDADGQHDVSNTPLLIEHARTFPTCLITGIPQYDDTVNIGRFIGRYITHVWVWIETLSFSIKDSMCGFRVYPVKETLTTISSCNIGDRMDFDTEIMVRMYWRGIMVKNVPVRVKYIKGGLSHFRMFHDNLLISRMHTRLFFGMLLRLPRLLVRKLLTGNNDIHWSRQKEKGTYIGLKFLFLIYRIFGKKIFSIFLHPVVLFFYVFSPDKRRASRKYLQKVNQVNKVETQVRWYHCYAHFVAFGYCMLEKLVSWVAEDLPIAAFRGVELYQDLELKKQGAVFIGSHLGNLEYCRALSRKATNKTINAVVFLEHAENFNRILKEVNPDFDINLVHVSSFGIDTAINFREKISNGEILVIVGDRTSPFAGERNVEADFLGEMANFPQGPFILASLMDCPVYLLFCIKQQEGYNIYLEPFREKASLPRKGRQDALKQLVQDYANRLEYFCLKAPFQWFNFFDFWKKQEVNNDNE